LVRPHEQVRIGDRGGADDDPIDAQREGQLQIGPAAQATRELDGHRHRPADLLGPPEVLRDRRVIVAGTARRVGQRAVQVDDVNRLGAVGDPHPGLCCRVLVEGDLGLRYALVNCTQRPFRMSTAG